MFGNVPNFSRTRTAPTGYEKVRLLFHAIRTAQLFSSIIVGSMVIYFLWWLVHDNEARPWTFIFLTVTSFLTVIVLTATLVAHCLTGLNPRVNLALNLFNLCLWILSYSMLTYWSWDTLTNACDEVNWIRDEGVMICQIYKALFSFALIGLVATAAAVALDIHIYRLATRFGTHMRLDNMDQKPRVVDARNASYADEEGRRSEAFEVPQAGYGAQQKAQLLGVGEGEGYERPSGQFSYDTGYHGGHADRVFGAAQ